MSALSEAIEAFRGLNEAVAKPGDYVSAKDGRSGFVQAVNGGMVSFWWSGHDASSSVTLPASVLTVNPGGPPR